MSDTIRYILLTVLGCLNTAAGIRSIREGRDFMGGLHTFIACVTLISIGRLGA